MLIPIIKPPEAIWIFLTLILILSAALPIQAGQERGTSPADLAADLGQDQAALGRLRASLFQLAQQVKAESDLFGPRPAHDTALLRPGLQRRIFAIWYPIVDTYLALDTLTEKYSRFYELKDKNLRQQAFHLTRGAFLTQYRIALELIPVLEQNRLMDTLLNEAVPDLGLPPGVYAHFKYQYLNVLTAGRYGALEAVARVYGYGAVFQPHSDDSSAGPPADQHSAQPDAQLLGWASADSRRILAAGKGPGPAMTMKNGLLILKRAGQVAWFPVQKGVAQWMGQTKVWRSETYLIRPAQIASMAARIEPGDILLERREWYLTNVGIPGFWTHAALFIGSAPERAALSRHPDVRAWLEQHGAGSLDELIRRRYPEAHTALQRPYKDGHLPRIIESLAPGVSLTSLEHSAACDSLAVLRPRLSKKDKAAAIVRAMSYYGRPYDYAFDFGSDQSLVCTELIVKSYLPGEGKQGLRLPMENVMGQMVTPANAFVRRWAEAFATPDQQLDLVLFLDGNEKQKRAAEADVEVFRQSWRRPKWHILGQFVKSSPQ